MRLSHAGGMGTGVVGVFAALFWSIWPADPCTAGGPDRFVDVAESAGITFVHRTGIKGDWHYLETMGSGCALFDCDGDEDLDLYLVNGDHRVPGGMNALYRNDTTKGDIGFTDVSTDAEAPGVLYGMACTVGDYDADGDLDLYVTEYDSNLLYQNDGTGIFTDVTSTAGVAGGGWSAGATFFDMEADGDLDLYVVRYLTYDLETERPCDRLGIPTYCDPGFFEGAPDLLYRNEADGTFTDVSAESGVADPTGKGMSVVTLDYDDDGDSDLYVANDTTPNFLYRNEGGRFEELGMMSGCAFNAQGTPQAGMGIDVADIDGNGWQDLFVTNFAYETNGVYRNGAGGFFMEESVGTGVAGTSLLPLGFGVNLFDADHDGDSDLFVANGHIFPNVKEFSAAETYAQPDQFLRNTAGRFEAVDAGVEPPAVGRGTSVGDLDGDGDLDLVVSNSDARPFVYRNDGERTGHWLMVKLVGGVRRSTNRLAGLSNGDGIGGVVRVTAGGRTQVKEVRAQSSYGSVSDFRLHFGLGDAERIEKIEVRWPGGRVQALVDLPVDQVIDIEEAE